METTPPSKRLYCKVVKEETDIDVVNKRQQDNEGLSRQHSTSNTEYYQKMLEIFWRALTDHRVTDQLI